MAGPARIGLVIGQLTYGGAESQLYELAHHLARDHTVFVYCLSSKDQPYGDRLRAAGVEVRVLPANGSLDWSRVRRLAAALRADRIELVHAYLFIASAYAYLATRRLPGVVLVGSARNCKLEPSAVRRFVLRRAFGACDAVLCNSEEMARFATRHYGAPESRLHVVYNGVDLDRFSARGRVDGQSLRIGTVGRLERQKNFDVFVDAAGLVLKRHPNALFEVVGEGSLRAEVEGKVAAEGLSEHVRLVGTQADVPGFLSTLDQFWLTSDWEGTPNVVLEAMAASVPVVATAVGGTPEIVADGETGFLVPPGDAPAVAEAALSLAGDPATASAMSRASRRRVEERYSTVRMTEATLAVYAAASDRRKRTL